MKTIPPICCPHCHTPLPNFMLRVNQLAQVLGESRRSVSNRLRKFEMAWRPIGKGRKHKRIPIWEVARWINARLVHNPEELRLAVDGRSKIR